MNLPTFVIRNALRNRLRFALTVGTVAAAFCLLALFQATSQGLMGNIANSETGQLIVLNKASASSPLPIKYLEHLSSYPQVAEIGYADWFGGYFQRPENSVPVIAVNGDAYLKANPDFTLDPLSLRNWLANRNGILVSEKMAQRMNILVGQKFSLGSSIWKRSDNEPYWDFIVSGIYQTSEDSVVAGLNLFMHYDYLNEVKIVRKNTVGAFSLLLNDPNQYAQISQSIDAHFANSGAATSTMTLAAYAETMLSQMVNISEVIKYVMGVIFVTSIGILAANISNNLRDRRKEVALTSAIGFSHHRLFSLFFCENALLLLSGTGLGYLLGFAIISVLYEQIGLFLPAFGLSVSGVLTGIGIAAGISLILAVLPLRELYTLKLSEQLKAA